MMTLGRRRDLITVLEPYFLESMVYCLSIAMYCHVLPCIAMYCHVLPCIAMYSHAMPCIAMYYHALPCIAV